MTKEPEPNQGTCQACGAIFTKSKGFKSYCSKDCIKVGSSRSREITSWDREVDQMIDAEEERFWDERN